MRYRRYCHSVFMLAVLLVSTVPVWADSFIMTSPLSNNVLAYSDEILTIRFTVRKDSTASSLAPEYTGIAFTLTNKTDRAITILWDQSSIILPNGSASPVMHEGSRFLTAGESVQVPTVIPPRSSLSDSVVPTRNIVNLSSGWSSRSLGLVTGSQFGLYLATEIEGTQHNYDFRFRASQITPTGGTSAMNALSNVLLWVLIGILAVGLIVPLVILASF